jgi:hypothetical protein
VIWPHGWEKLNDFHHHLNSICNNIHCTLEAETNGHIPFLDIDVYRRHYSSLGHRVHRKLTHINLYINATSHYKQAVLCPPQFTRPGMSVIPTVFHKNSDFCMKPSGIMVVANDRFFVLSTRLWEPHYHQADGLVLTLHHTPSASAGLYPNTASKPWVSHQVSSSVFFDP